MAGSLIDALMVILSNPYHIALIVGSVAAGNLIGVLPGLGVIFGIVVLLPFTLRLPPEVGIVTLMAIFVGAATGGGWTAALIGIPGTPMAVATLFDAYPMAKRGQAQEALGYVVTASVFGGIFSALILTFFSPFLARIALKFGPPEYVLLVTLGLVTIAFVSRGTFIKGVLTGLLGLAISTVGTDLATALPRFTFGISELSMGLGLIPVLLGLFAIPEVISLLETEKASLKVPEGKFLPKWPTWSHWRNQMSAYIRSSLIGTAIGALPGAGADIASFISYAEEKRASKHPELLGTGRPEGIIASEASNNAVTGGALIPTLTLGIPGDAATAIIMGVLYMHGLSPGPDLYTQRGDLLAYIYVGMLFANVVMLFMGMYLSGPFLVFLKLEKGFMVLAIMLLCMLGVWAIQTSMFDLWTMLGFGLLSYFLRKLEAPLSPIILGFILGPLFEQNFRRALTMSEGSATIFVTRPYSLMVIGLLIIVLWGAYRSSQRIKAASQETSSV
jgi:putative tricarboxylic transport membrane protein